jgi:hypothetical protein
MITPDDIIPPDDSDESEMDDQQSQKDIHSNGLEEDYEAAREDEHPDASELKQAYDAAESSFTLHIEEEEDHDD